MQQLITSPTRREQTITSILGQRADWRMLAQDGVMVRVVIGRCGFTAKLELGDIGVTIADERVRKAIARTVVLGEKRLLPESYMTDLARIESQARRLLAKNSFYIKASGFVLGYFLPVTAYTAWKEETEECKKRYFSLRDKIIAKHEELVEQVLSDYRTVAADTYRRIKEVRPDAVVYSEEEFVASYCERIISLIPDKTRIEETFKFDVELMDALKSLEGLAEEQEGEQGLAVGATQIRNQAQAREWQRQQMQRDVLSQAQAKKKTVIDSFLASIVTQLRSLTYDAVTDVLASIERRGDGKFPPRSLRQLKNLVEQIGQLNFYGDQDIERFMAQIKSILNQQPARRNRSLSEIRAKLRDIALVSRATLLELEVNPRTAREMEIPDMLAEGDVREARQELGLDLDDLSFLKQTQMRGERLAEDLSLWGWVEEEQEPRGQRLA
jgi:hypothetical protein